MIAGGGRGQQGGQGRGAPFNQNQGGPRYNNNNYQAPQGRGAPGGGGNNYNNFNNNQRNPGRGAPNNAGNPSPFGGGRGAPNNGGQRQPGSGQPRGGAIAIWPFRDMNFAQFLTQHIQQGTQNGKNHQMLDIIPNRPPENITGTNIFVLHLQSNRLISDATYLCNQTINYNGEEITFLVGNCSVTDIDKVNQLEEILISRYRDPFLNLSAIEDESKIQVSNKFVLQFFLFCVATFCREKNWTVTTIDFKNNNISDTFGFNGIKNLFPELENISLAGNNLNLGDENNKRPFQGINVIFVESTESLKVVLETPSSIQRYHLTLDNFPPFPLEIEDSFINKLIVEFLDCCWTDISSIGQYYLPTSIFSIMVDTCHPDSPLAKSFKQFDRNLLHPTESTLDNFATGPQVITCFQCELFPTGFCCHPLCVRSTIIWEDRCSVVIHGVFEDKNKNLFGFDRSMLIIKVEDGMYIANDHLFIREARP